MNKSMLQVLADVFNAPVYTQENVDSAVVGGAYQAKMGLNARGKSYEDIISVVSEPTLCCRPYGDVEDIYLPMADRFRRMVGFLAEATATTSIDRPPPLS